VQSAVAWPLELAGCGSDMLLVLGVGNGRRGAGLLYEEPGEGVGHAALGSVAGGEAGNACREGETVCPRALSRDGVPPLLVRRPVGGSRPSTVPVPGWRSRSHEPGRMNASTGPLRLRVGGCVPS